MCFHRPSHRLWAAVATVAAFLYFPTGCQIAYLNQPGHLFRQWIDRSSGFEYSSEAITTIWSLIVSSRLFGDVLGCMMLPCLSTKMGPRDILRFASVPLFLGEILSFVAVFVESISCLFVGRLISGLGDGFLLISTSTFLAEISPKQHRGKVLGFTPIIREAGVFFSLWLTADGVLGQQSRLPYIFLLPALLVLPAPFLLGLFPESPRYLYVIRGDSALAQRSFEYYQGRDNELTSVQDAYSLTGAPPSCGLPDITNHWSDSRFRRAFWISISFATTTVFCGRFILLNYSADLIQELGVDRGTAEKTVIIIMGASAFVMVLTMLFNDQVGRRPLLLGALWLAIFMVVALMIGQFSLTVPNSGNVLPFPLVIAASIGIGIWTVAIMGGIRPLAFIPIELFTQKSRPLGMSVYILAIFAMGGFTTAVFPILQHLHWGAGMAFLLAPLLITTAILCIFLPETSNRTMEDIVRKKPSTINSASQELLNSSEFSSYGT